MFTGLIEEVGPFRMYERGARSCVLTIVAKKC